MGNSQFERDFNEQSALKRPGRLDFRTLNNTDDAGDGYPGVQKAIRNYFHEGYLEKDIDLNDKSLVDVSSIDGGGDAVVLNDDIDLNNNDLQNVKAIDGNGNAIILNDDINMNSKDLQNVKAIDIDAGAITIGTITPTDDQWVIVGEMDQDVSKNQSPEFVGLNLSANLVTSSTIDDVDVGSHTHSGAGTNGVKVPFSNLDGNIAYGQVSSIVDTTTTGDENKISRADHVHTDGDGSSKIAHVNTTGIGEDNHHAKTHNNNEHSTDYKPDFSENGGFNRAFGTTTNTVIHGNDGRLSNARTPTSHSHLTGDLTHTLDNAFDDGKIISGATNTFPFEVGGDTNYRFKFWRSSSSLYMSVGSNITDLIIQCERNDGDIHFKPKAGGSVYLGYGDSWVASWNGMLRPVGDNIYQLGNVGAAPSKGYFHLLYHNGINPTFSHVDDLQLLRETEEDQILKEKKDKDGKIVGTQRAWKKESLPWIKARPDLKGKTGDQLNFATSQGEEVGYILSTMKKLLERQDDLVNQNLARDLIIDSLITRLDILENK